MTDGCLYAKISQTFFIFPICTLPPVSERAFLKRDSGSKAEQTDEINSVGLFFIIFMRCKCVNSLVV